MRGIQNHQTRCQLSSVGESVPTAASDFCGVWHGPLVLRVVHTEILLCSPQLLRMVIWVAVACLSDHTPLTCLINKVFLSAELILTGCFSLHTILSQNSRDCCVWGSLEITISETLKPARLASTIVPQPKSLRNSRLHCCHSIGWLKYLIKRKPLQVFLMKHLVSAFTQCPGIRLFL